MLSFVANALMYVLTLGYFKFNQPSKSCWHFKASEHRNTWHPLRNDQATSVIIINWLHSMAFVELYHFHVHLRVFKGHDTIVRLAKSFPSVLITLDRDCRGMQVRVSLRRVYNLGCMKEFASHDSRKWSAWNRPCKSDHANMTLHNAEIHYEVVEFSNGRLMQSIDDDCLCLLAIT